jgi:hypothetical protein
MGVVYHQAGQATPTLQKKSPLTLNEEDLRSPVIFLAFLAKIWRNIEQNHTRNFVDLSFFHQLDARSAMLVA